MGVIHLAEARPSIGGASPDWPQRQAPVAAAHVDRCHRAAVAVQRIARHDLAFRGYQPEDFKRRVQFRAVVGRAAGQGFYMHRAIQIDTHHLCNSTSIIAVGLVYLRLEESLGVLQSSFEV